LAFDLAQFYGVSFNFLIDEEIDLPKKIPKLET